MKIIKDLEIFGAIFTIVVGSLLHFVFEWSGRVKVVALFAAVNESTWEHLKLAFWPTFIFAIIEWFILRKEVLNFCYATAVKLFLMPFTITVLFYSWRAFFRDNFFYDILIFILAVLLGYFVSYRIMKVKEDMKQQSFAAVIILILLGAFSLSTYFPPKNFLFCDPVDGGYGVKN